MENLTKESKPYKTGDYEEIFAASSTGNLSKEEVVAYSQSYFKELDHESAVRFAEKNILRKNVRNLRKHGMQDEVIAQMLEYPLHYIQSL